MTAHRTTAASAFSRGLLVAGLALLACLAAQFVSAGQPRALLIWPATGIAFAFGWRHGSLWLLPAALGAFVWGLLATVDPVFAGLAALTTLPGPALAIECLRRIGQWKPTEHRLDAVVRFLLVTLGVAAPVTALLVLVGQALAPQSLGLGAAGPALWLAVWLADTLGMLLVAPLVLSRMPGSPPDAMRGAAAQAEFDIVSVLAGLLIAGISLFLADRAGGELAFLMLFAVFPVLAASAIRVGERAVSRTLLLTLLPLLAARAYVVGAAPDPNYGQAIGATLVALAAVLFVLLLQATSADRRLALQRVTRQAGEDMSTGLLNDRGLHAELADRLGAPNRVNHGLIGLHISNFDAIHDLCGTLDAMQLEQSTAQLLLQQDALQFAARLSAGRYALLVDADTVARTRATARDLYAQLNGQLFQTEHGSIRLQCCVGGLLLDAHTLISSEDCMSALGDALAIAASVRDPQLFVEPLSQTMIDARRAHQNKIEHIREAIRDNRIELYAQPLIDPDAPAGMISYEILTRLRDRDGELIRPPEFMTLATQGQMSIPLDRAVIRRTFEWLAAHPEALARTWKCSINLAGATMSDGTIAEFIREHRARHELPAARFVFEITEGEAIRNPAAASRLVDDLKLQGFGIALDDFGTGLATFEYLKRFPLDYLKIDGSFIRNLLSNPIDEEIVLSTIRVAERLKLRTVAEHVHSAAIYQRLTEMGVRYLQGDYFGRAMPLVEVFRGPAGPDRRADGTGNEYGSLATTVDGPLR